MSELFGTIAQKRIIPDLYSGSAVNYKYILKFMRFKSGDIARILKLKKTTIRFDDRASPEIESFFVLLANIIDLVAETFEGDVIKTRLWFMVDNAFLGGVSPRKLILFGRIKKLHGMIINLKNGDIA